MPAKYRAKTRGTHAREEVNRQQNKEDIDALKQEVAQELHLDDDITRRGWENMTTRETGKIGGQMVRRLIRKAKQDLAGEQKP